MELESILPILMFPTLFLLILTGFPVAFVLAGTGFIFATIGYFLDLFTFSDFGFVPSRVFDLVIKNITLIAVPLFIFMGVTLEKSGISEDLLVTAERMFRRIKGGLTISIILVGALLAASTGIVGATVVTMGVLSLPTMVTRGYNKELACGTIAASGTLGQIIPPSIVLVILGDMMQVAVADLFAGAIIPGICLVLIYSLYVFIRSSLNPELTPALDESGENREPLGLAALKSVIPPLLLMLLVLGSILTGQASPTESAACGAVGALALAAIRQKLTRDNLLAAMRSTTNMTAMVFTLLLGAQIFGAVFRGLYGDEVITDFITDLEVSPHLIFFIIMVLIFLLGFFLDFIEICFIVIPIVSPILIGELGFNGIWVAIMFAINLQTSFLTPPFGFALFYLKGVSPPEVTTLHIYRGVVPFVLLQLVMIVLLALFPALATWLPALLFDTTS